MSDVATLENSFLEFERRIHNFYGFLYGNSEYLHKSPEFFKNTQTNSVFAYLKNEQERIYTSSGSTDQHTTYTSKIQPDFLNQVSALLSNLLSDFFNFLSEIAQIWSKQILPEFFDLFVNVTIKFARKFKVESLFPLNWVVNIFTLIGMSNINAKTIQNITGAVQFKIIPVSWINIPFWSNYLETLPSEANPELIKAVRQMIFMAKIIEDDNIRATKSQAEIHRNVRFG